MPIPATSQTDKQFASAVKSATINEFAQALSDVMVGLENAKFPTLAHCNEPELIVFASQVLASYLARIHPKLSEETEYGIVRDLLG